MKIIKSGQTKKPKDNKCTCRCKCVFTFTQDEARHVADSRDGDAFVIVCPECGYENWVDATLVS